MAEKTFSKIPADAIKLGMRFSAPVFFDDKVNMFLAEGKTVKRYHLNSIARWKIRYLLTYGHVIKETSFVQANNLLEIENTESADDVEELI